MHSVYPFQQALADYMSSHRFDKAPQNLYEPADYIMSLGGKRLRPVLALIGHSLFSEGFEKSLPAAMAIEVFHNFTLVHDDIMDAAPLRRGKPTVHSVYGLNAGILSGDVMLIRAYQYLLELGQKELLPEILDIFSRTAVEVCEGQQMDMDFETMENVDIPDYLKMIELKTSVLIAAALQIGARLGGASEKDARLLYDFGKYMGIAFQLQDDILDAFGDPEKVGKKPGGDVAQRKKTFLYLKALEMAAPDRKERLKNWFAPNAAMDDENVGRILALWRELGVREEAEAVKQIYQRNALQALDGVNAPNSRKQVLYRLAEVLLGRES
jgi:geranylgeranyl diphosphate synthase, type II